MKDDLETAQLSRETINHIPLFSELSDSDLHELIACSSLCRFNKSDIIFYQDEHYKGFYILLKGTVTASIISETGHEAIVHILRPLSMFAEIPLFEGLNYPVTAKCTENSVAIFIPKEGFLNLLSKSPHLSIKMLAGLSKRTRELIHQIEITSTRDVTGRLAHFLLTEIKSNNSLSLEEPFVVLKLPKATLATFLGTITETLSRTIKKLADEQVIRINNKTLYITNLHRLKELADK